MIKREDLFQAIGEIDEERLEQTEFSVYESYDNSSDETADLKETADASRNTDPIRKRVFRPQYIGIAVAACILIAIGVGIPGVMNFQRKYSGSYEGSAMKDASQGMADSIAQSDEAVVDLDAEADDSYNGVDNNRENGEVPAGPIILPENAFVLQTEGTDIQGTDHGIMADMAEVYIPISDELRSTLGFKRDEELTEADLGNYIGHTSNNVENTEYPVYTTVVYSENTQYVIVDKNGIYSMYQKADNE